MICKTTGKEMHIHHLDKNRLNNTISNLFVVCNKCHQQSHTWQRCDKCGRLKPKESHTCPTNEERNLMGKIAISKRERCEKCGKMFGFKKENHSCEHPKGFKGHTHTEDEKRRISESVRRAKALTQ
jgi:hypothetical protein